MHGKSAWLPYDGKSEEDKLLERAKKQNAATGCCAFPTRGFELSLAVFTPLLPVKVEISEG